MNPIQELAQFDEAGLCLPDQLRQSRSCPLGSPRPIVEALGVSLRRERGIENDPLRGALKTRNGHLSSSFSNQAQVRENHVSLNAECLGVRGGSEFSLELAPFLANRAEGSFKSVRPSGGGEYRHGSIGPSHRLHGFEERF